jgi:hypothetical protein
VAFARALRAFGEVSGARIELERARTIFVRVGATTRRDAIDRELSKLVEGPAYAGPSTVDAADGAPGRSPVRRSS